MYYDLFPRIWVVLAGAVAALLPVSRKAGSAIILGISGFALMLVPAFMRTETAKILACCVVAGSFLSLQYLPSCPVIARLLQNKVLVWLGRISFSLYLVHLPVITIYRSLHGIDELPITAIALLIPIILAGGYAFYRCIENKHFSRTPVLAATGLCLIIAPAAIYTQGFARYIHKRANSVEFCKYTDFGECQDSSLTHDYPGNELTYWDGVYRFTKQAIPEINSTLLHIGDSGKPANFILLGDCQAHTLYAGLHECCRKEGLSGVFAATYMLSFWNRQCQEGENRVYTRNKAEAMLNWLSKHPEIEHVILAQLWSYWMPPETKLNNTWDGKPHPCNTLESATKDIMELCKKLQGIGKNVIILNEVPTISANSPIRVVRGQLCFSDSVDSPSIIQTAADYASKNKPYRDCLEKVQAAGLCTLLHTHEIHLRDGQFSAWKNEQVMMHDSMHQTYPAALITAEGIMPQLKAILSPP